MKTREIQMSLHRIAVALTTMMLTACAGQRANESIAALPPEQAVNQLAMARWKDVIDGRWEQAYARLTPGTRDATPYDAYSQTLAMRQIDWTDAAVESVECDSAERCTATVRVSYVLKRPIVGTKPEAASTVAETWLFLDGAWYHLPAQQAR